ncbi:MAG: PCMD domain-containing protein [Tannerellaceae bacterium]|jgi:hypothetical protein|nr:PCMD domain-containing protein [Tannerellaceae bacterium]
MLIRTKHIKIVAAWVLLGVAGSCIREEPPCPYADIEAFSLPGHIMQSEATINGENISVFIRHTVDVSAIAPTIVLSEGATIKPSADTPQDFSQPVTYTVTAADGKHQRVYTVQLISTPLYVYGFEHWEVLDKTNKYETPVEYDLRGIRSTPWDSSNKGIAIYQQYTDASLYPIHKTTRSAEGQYAVEMLTKQGPGSILGIVHIPVVAGSLFTGVLNPLNALKNPLLATAFGQPFDEKPLRMTGKYIYQPGAGYYIDSKGTPHPEKKDSCAVYAVFFRSDKTLERLDGTNILTHPHIVAVAMLPSEDRAGTPGNDFASFDIPFVYDKNHVVDFERNTYKLAIVFSSSFMGDYYEGTPGSCLIVDDIAIKTEEK